MAEYAEFAQCKSDFEGMKRVYALYKQQKIAINNWGKILWSFLNPNQLIEGIEVYMKDFNKLDKKVSNLQLCCYHHFTNSSLTCVDSSITRWHNFTNENETIQRLCTVDGELKARGHARQTLGTIDGKNRKIL